MTTGKSKYSSHFNDLTNAVDEFIEAVDKSKMSNVATEEWTVKDVLRHIVFWHEYYAQQYAALAKGKEPFIMPSKGGVTRNERGIENLKGNSKDQLIKDLKKHHKSLHESIVVHKVPKMDYTDKREYSTEDFLVTITRHITSHGMQIKKANCNPSNK